MASLKILKCQTNCHAESVEVVVSALKLYKKAGAVPSFDGVTVAHFVVVILLHR